MWPFKKPSEEEREIKEKKKLIKSRLKFLKTERRAKSKVAKEIATDLLLSAAERKIGKLKGNNRIKVENEIINRLTLIYGKLCTKDWNKPENKELFKEVKKSINQPTKTWYPKSEDEKVGNLKTVNKELIELIEEQTKLKDLLTRLKNKDLTALQEQINE